MSGRVRLIRVCLHYGPGLVLHTASSGAVPELREARLVAERGGVLEAVGASRTNIAYLSGIPAAEAEAAMLDAAAALDWDAPAPWAGLAAQLDTYRPALPAVARMAFEMAAADARARAAGVPLWRFLGGMAQGSTRLDAWNGCGGGSGPETLASGTNQTLFWQDEPAMLARAEAYAARGFTELKLRIGIAPFAEDLERFRHLRERLGPAARLSVDANGTWDGASAPGRLHALAALGAEYVEQPLPAAAWDETAALSRASPVPIMLDESLDGPDAVRRLARERTAPLAHLKLAKLGGLDRLMEAGRTLAAAGIGVMVGQMNEGAVSTLAAAHGAIALGASLRELYGADGLLDDPAEPAPAYREGSLCLPPGPGLGITGHAPGGTVLWERPLP